MKQLKNKNVIIDSADIEQLIEQGYDEKSILEYMQNAVLMLFSNEKIEIDDDKSIEISLSFVSLEEIRTLNREYRSNDKETDVLSFPQFENVEEIRSELEKEYTDIFLGDVVISLDKVKEQSVEFQHSMNRELVYLFIHSILHLMGYDHMEEDEKKVMRQKEKDVINELMVEV